MTTAHGATAASNPGRSGKAFDCGEKVKIVTVRGAVPISVSVSVPNVVGQSLNKAETRLYCLGLKYAPLSVTSPSASNGSIVGQSPRAGTMMQLPDTVPVHILVACCRNN